MGSPPDSPWYLNMRRKATAWPNSSCASGCERSASSRAKASLSSALSDLASCLILVNTPFNAE
jgi:hypothetical protein